MLAHRGMGHRRATAFVAAIVVALLGCEDEAPRKKKRIIVEETAEVEQTSDQEARLKQERQQLEREKRELEARESAQRAAEQREQQVLQELKSNPGKFLRIANHEVRDKGIVNDYRQLSSLTIENQSKHAVKAIRGTVEWIDASGNVAGSTSFSIDGTITAGDTKTFERGRGLVSGTIQSDGQAKIRFDSLEVVSSAGGSSKPCNRNDPLSDC
jgi:hypothetical protein